MIFGEYDDLYEPGISHDNCDFFLISDTVNPPENSIWRKMDPKPELIERTKKMSNVAKNRFFKMHPQLLFPEYKYSVYLDGNVQLFTDPTEFINRMPKEGVMIHKHPHRNCVYDEIKAILALNKAPAPAMEKLMDYLKTHKMPSHYGLLKI